MVCQVFIFLFVNKRNVDIRIFVNMRLDVFKLVGIEFQGQDYNDDLWGLKNFIFDIEFIKVIF